MRRILPLMLCLMLLHASTGFAAPLTRNTGGKSPAPSRLIDGECTVTKEMEDGFVYRMYSGAADADWRCMLKLLQYTGYIPTEATTNGSNRSVYAYNLEFGTTVLVQSMPSSLMVASPKEPGMLNDEELAPIVSEYQMERPLPEAVEGRAIYPSFEAVSGAKVAEQGVRSAEHIYEGKTCHFEHYLNIPFSKVADYLAYLIALGYDIKILFHSDNSNSPLDCYYFCTRNESQLIVQFATITATVYYEPDVDWYELNADEISQLFGE